ncbi:MAG TPA: aspartate aminotransferase family protein [Bacteroidota bacterium]|jgi:4-aminobutyrate aminotransferase-like enzyme|nr:aspartate aminotransferase family protein [Bacteroidota bacterium]
MPGETITKKAMVNTEIPGPKSKAIFDFEQQYIAPGTQTIATLSQLAMEKGEGCIVQDVDGNRYIDFFAGVAVSSLGYNHPRYVKAIQEQVAKIHVGSFSTKVRADLSKLLSEIGPGDVCRAQYYSGGAEAVEAALRLAKSYTKKTEVIGFWGGFHGKTLGVVGLIGDDFKHQLGPLPPGIYNTPYASCRRCPLNHTFPECDWACVDFIKQKIKIETTNNIAAIIVEPIQGTNGNLVPPAGYLKELRRIADEIKAVLIVDEMITGFGRTGKMFGCQHDDIVPDIMTIGKSFGGGYPMTGVMATEKIIFSKPFANPSGSSSSYGGNPLASAAAYVTVKTIIEDGLVANSARVGAFMLNKLMGFKDKFPFVGDVRGKGLLIGVELVKNRQTKEKLDKETCKLIFRECLKRGLIVMGYNPDIRINPPLIIDEATAEEGIDIMDEVFTLVADRINV